MSVALRWLEDMVFWMQTKKSQCSAASYSQALRNRFLWVLYELGKYMKTGNKQWSSRELCLAPPASRWWKSHSSRAEGHPPATYWSEKVAGRLEEATAKREVWKEWKPSSVSYYKWTATPYSNPSLWAWARTFCWTRASPPKGRSIYLFIGLAMMWYVFSLTLDEDPTGYRRRISSNRYAAHMLPPLGRWSPRF